MNVRIILTLVLIILGISFQVYAQSCTEVAGEIRSINSPAFNEYPLLNDVKQDMLLILYGRERGTCPQYIVDFATATRDFILKFDGAYKLANSDISENHIKAVELARQLKGDVAVLDTMKGDFGVEGQDLVSSGEQLVRNFLIIQAENYERDADATEVTRRKILFYKEASLAFEAADETLEATNNKIKQIAFEEEYLQDMGVAEELFTRAESKFKEAQKLIGGDIFSRINAYISARSASIEFKQARAYYQYHHETERITNVDNNLAEVEKTLFMLQSYLALWFGATAGILIIVAVLLIHRLNAWNRDTYDYNLGNELVQVSSSET